MSRAAAAEPRLDVFVCGGSQLAASGLPPTAALPARVARGLRAVGGAARVHPVYCDVDPGRLPGQLAERLSGQPFAVVLIPRNVPVVLTGLADAARRLVAADVSLPAELPAPRSSGRWARVRRRATGHAWYLAWLLTLPARLARYALGLERAIAACRRRGCRLFVLATPVPYPARLGRRAGAYQRALSALIRRRRGGGVAVADLFACLTAEGADPILPDDPHHLTVGGHARAAEELVAVLAAELGWRDQAGQDLRGIVARAGVR